MYQISNVIKRPAIADTKQRYEKKRSCATSDRIFPAHGPGPDGDSR